MKVFLSLLLFVFITTEIKAQVASSSLYITLSDIQSVKIIELPSHSNAQFSEKKSGKGNLLILNPSASQVRKFESQFESAENETEQTNKSFQIEIPASGITGSVTNMPIAKLNQHSNRSVPLVVYQIDPR